MDYYKLLGIKKNDEKSLTPENLKHIYFTMVRKYPPEKNPEEFKKIKEAYDVLKDLDLRLKYDQSLEIPKKYIHDYEEAVADLENGMYNEAIKTFEFILSKCKKPVTVIQKKLLKAYVLNKNKKKSVVLAEELLKTDTNEKDYLLILGERYSEMNYNKKADNAFKEYFEKYGRDAKALIINAKSLINLKKRDLALIVLDQAFIHINKEDTEPIDILMAIQLYTEFNVTEKAVNLINKLAQVLEQVKVPSKEFFEGLVYLWKICYKKPEILCATEYLANYYWAKKIRDIDTLNILLDEFLHGFYEDDKIADCLKTIISDKAVQLTSVLERETNDEDDLRLFTAYMAIITNTAENKKAITYLRQNYPMIFPLEKELFLSVLNSDKEFIINKAKMSFYELKQRNPEIFYLISSTGAKGIEEHLEGLKYITTETYVRGDKKISRNDPCPCGSGKKYKHCCNK